MRRVRRNWTDQKLDDIGRRASSGIRLGAVEETLLTDTFLLSGQAVKLTAARQLDGVIGQ